MAKKRKRESVTDVIDRVLREDREREREQDMVHRMVWTGCSCGRRWNDDYNCCQSQVGWERTKGKSTSQIIDDMQRMG